MAEEQVRHFQKKGRDTFVGALYEQKDVMLHPAQVAAGQVPELASPSVSASAITALRLITSTLDSAMASAEKIWWATRSRRAK